MEAIDDETLKDRLEAAWKMRAPKRLIPTGPGQYGGLS
jgi:hypothetical protein